MIRSPSKRNKAKVANRYLESLTEYSLSNVHLAIAERCLKTYVRHSNQAEDVLSRYACVYWGLHCEKAGDRSEIKQLVLDFLYAKEYFYDCLDDMHKTLCVNSEDRSTLYRKLHALVSDPINPLFAVSLFGLTEAIENDRESQHARLSQLNADGASCLYLAARSGHVDVADILVSRFLDYDLDLDVSGGQFGSALQAAAFAGHAGIVRVLLLRGASIFNVGEFPDAIQAALSGGFEDIACSLFEFGYKDARRDNLNAILNFACFGGYIDMVKAFARCRHWEVHDTESSLQNALVEGKRREAQILITQIHDINAQEGIFGNALSAAVCGGSLPLVKLLLDRGAEINKRGRFGSPLRAAVVSGHMDIVRWLLDQ